MAIIKQMSGQVSRGSAGDYQADEQAGVAPQLVIIKQMSGQVPAAQLVIIKQMNGQVPRSSTCDYQADERAGVAMLNWLLSSR